MAQNKTKPTSASVDAYLSSIEPDRKRQDALALHALFRRVTGWQPTMWGDTMVGYGRYTYTYETGHSGEMLATGFAPRKASLSLYIMPGYADFGGVLKRLGKHKKGKACLYINKLADVDEAVLAELIEAGLEDLKGKWEVEGS